MSAVDHPAHYGGEENPYEVIKVAEAWDFDKDAYLFNVLKYIARPGKGNYLEDLKKARFYLDRKIQRLEEAEPTPKSESLWPVAPAPQFVEGSGTSIQPEGTIDAWLDGRPYRIYDDIGGTWIRPIGSDRWFKVKL